MKLLAMVDYYYSNGTETFGPYSIDQLRDKQLAPETLVWHERLSEWAQLKDLPEAATYVSLKRTPPPIPPLNKRGEIDGQTSTHRLARGRTVYLKDEEIIISRTVIKWLMVWVFFHMFALFTSYKEIKLFNDGGEPRPQNFWPFVNFIDEYYVKAANTTQEVWETRLKFNGMFVNYDWTEFGSYVGGLLLLVVFYYLYKKAD